MLWYVYPQNKQNLSRENMPNLESLRLFEGFLLTFQSCHYLPRIRHFSYLWVGVLPERLPLFSFRCEALQFLEPVCDNVKLSDRQFLLGSIDHEKSLAVGRNVVGISAYVNIRAFEQFPGRPGTEFGSSADIDDIPLAAKAIEHFKAILAPARLLATLRRALCLSPWTRIRPDINFPPSRFVRCIRHPVAVR